MSTREPPLHALLARWRRDFCGAACCEGCRHVQVCVSGGLAMRHLRVPPSLMAALRHLAFGATVLVACGSTDDGQPSGPLGPSCPGMAGNLGVEVSSQCAGCLLAWEPGYGDGICVNFLSCYCACQALDAGCQAACVSKIDSDPGCVGYWNGFLLLASNECHDRGGPAPGCKTQCDGQSLAVSEAALRPLQAKYGISNAIRFGCGSISATRSRRNSTSS
jgi:hypothetical protein